MQLTDNFNKSEFECSCGCDMPEEVFDNIKILAQQLQVIRDMLCESIKVTSGYRCKNYNKKIGGAKYSQHLLGKASDLQMKETRPEELANAIDKLQEAKFIEVGGLGRYINFTHYDIRGYEARWGKN